MLLSIISEIDPRQVFQPAPDGYLGHDSRRKRIEAYTILALLFLFINTQVQDYTPWIDIRSSKSNHLELYL